ncbi:NAD(P)/FAD-dependent oxidoreductase [Desulfohalovibrio reitneri]|uniref:NAD(P)/FAD-dependent oxidoreductase n=1 Tax=Desulfohalovibrio reitneri TaxID=1307759 RepID=UPI0004A77B97|nr:FAD-dependent oxidoreductase [Desulfohalovibrio reitneri]
MQDVYDAIVIGGGPAGMTSALYLLRSHLRVAQIEKLSGGGQLLLTERIDNYPGFPGGALGYELADSMAEQVKEWESEDNFRRITDEVSAIETGKELHRIKVGDEWITGRVVIICSGAEYRKLGLPGEAEFTGNGVSYCALCDGNFFRDKVVAVIGGGNSALEEALYLARLVDKLYLIHRRQDFRGAKCYQDKCFVHPKMSVMRSTVVEAINGDQGGVTSISTRNVESGEARDIDVDGVFIFVGFQPLGTFIPEEMDRDERGFLKTDQEMRTNIPGVFAAGDIRSKMTRQVATAVGDGAAAASAAIAYLEQHVS